MNSNDKFFLNFKEENNVIYFTGKYMEILIPYYYFESKMASIIEDRIETLGIFLIRVFKDENSRDNAINHVYQFPSMIATKPSTFNKENVTVNHTKREFMVCKYYTNDVFINSNIIVQSSAFANQYITFYHNGKIPNFVNYDDVFLLELETTFINGMKFPVSAVILEGICSELNRDENDLSQSFRFAAADGANEKSYQPISIKNVPTYNSTFTSLTFEDVNYQLVSSVNRARYNKEEKFSSIEETIKY